ncbi:uncharacterized protein PHACADRAFT_30027 [Phanerochaete carnosa HHB-10118-sp]|uniref:Uncharacterized protein n=1 Tax=Phanerochaete carnosa (strain HHB-10118-sp) TaxID=650164 RepID=K5W7G4_PHACS|nr:uncharacterized protein PHACADRAFT_30027 [Phanerochaete carnosa HHB-10118-sp]EKM54899.1 hypothetical protein PHACADRAFT_30027 [Phanerochaete carnosa HHB-10118-sp]
MALPNGMAHFRTRNIFRNPALFYHAVKNTETNFVPEHASSRGTYKEFNELGLESELGCIVRGPHTASGYDDVTYGHVVAFLQDPINGHDKAIVSIEVSAASHAGVGGDKPATCIINRTFHLRWDEITSQHLHLSLRDYTPNEFCNMLREASLVSSCCNRIHALTLVLAPAHRLCPSPYPPDTQNREHVETVNGILRHAVTFVHVTSTATVRYEHDDALKVFELVVPFSQLEVLRNEVGRNQSIAMDVVDTYLFCMPPDDVAHDLLYRESSLPPKFACEGTTRVSRRQWAVAQKRATDTHLWERVIPTFSCPCRKRYMDSRGRAYCAFHADPSLQ